MSGKAQHIAPSGNKWSVRKAGASRASKVFPTQEEAINDGKIKAKNQRTELFIHSRNGRITERISYGNVPFPPKG